MSVSLISYYKAIENTSKLMLDAARTKDWDEVVRLEAACAVLIEQLRERSIGVNLSVEQRAAKYQIMMTILRHDAEIRNLAEPAIEEFAPYFADLDSFKLH